LIGLFCARDLLKIEARVKFKRIVLRSYAKINLGLHILGRREDGYHEVRTIFQSIGLHDRLEIEVIRKRTIELEGDCDQVRPTQNLVVKAIKLLCQYIHVSQGFYVHLEKKIPLGAGLGGGSSNAATALLGITQLLGLNLSNQDLFEIGGVLGSDVPFFFVGGRALGVGRGSEVYPLEDQPAKYLLLLVPPYPVSTVKAYARLSLPLTKKMNKSMIPVFCPGYMDSLCMGNAVENDFERVVFDDFPELKQLKTRLLNRGADTAALTGSGSTLFALFKSKGDLLKARDGIKAKGTQLIPTRTLSRTQYKNCIVESLH
jgi:4-diphosphocytidyl-2-C-methyl-D-erythritol kinase